MQYLLKHPYQLYDNTIYRCVIFLKFSEAQALPITAKRNIISSNTGCTTLLGGRKYIFSDCY